MADYYSLLARAVSNLPKTSPPSSRLAIYDRARAALVNQLRSLKPQLPESDIAREESALDAAIARLEAEQAPPEAPAAPASEPVKSAAPVLRPPPRVEAARPVAATPIAPRVEAARPAPAAAIAPRAPTITAPVRAEPKLPSAAPVVAPSPRASTLSPPLTNRAPPATPQAAASEAPRISASVAPRASGVAARGLAEPVSSPVVTAKLESPARVDSAPRIASPLDGESGGAEAIRLEVQPPRPIAPPAREPERTNPWPWVALAVVVGLVGSVAVAAFLLRQKPQDLSIPDSSETAAPSSPIASGPKIDQRVANPPEPTDTATPAPTPTESASATPTPGTTPTAAPSPTPSSSPGPIASPTPSPSPQAAQPSIPVAARAAMLVAEGSDTQNPAVNLGAVVWSVVPPNAGQPGSGGFKAEVDIPDLKMHASMVMRKNVDANLPASHTIDFRATFEPGSSIKGIKDIGLPLMRRDDPPGADPLLGVHVKINDGYYLVGLNRADADIARNLDEIGTRGWFDFPMQLADDRIAKLTFEKSADGERVVTEAIAGWK